MRCGENINFGDKVFKFATLFFAVLIIVLFAAIIAVLAYQSRLSISKFGLGFLVNKQWNPVTENFGALVPIVGTLLTTAIALAVAIPIDRKSVV